MTSLLLVGKTGSGKSSTGNSILGSKVFKALTSATSVTKQVQYDYAVVNQREVKVVDGPGLMDTCSSAVESASTMCREIERAILISPDGYDAILIVTDMTRFTEEDRKVMRQLKSTFGEKFIERHCILVVTHADNYDPEENGESLEDWCDDQTGSFNEIKRECQHRVVPFFNKTQDEELKKEQVRRVFQFVDEIRSKYGRYDKGLFEEARGLRDQMLVKLKEPVLMEETEKKLRLMMQELKELDEQNKPSALQRLQQMRSEVTAVLVEVKDADQGTDALKSVENLVRSFNREIESKKEMIQFSINAAEKMKILEENSHNKRTKDSAMINELQAEIKKLKQNNAKMAEEFARKMANLEAEYEQMKTKQTDMKLRHILLGMQVVEKGIQVGRQTYSFIQEVKKEMKK